jgi:hypothetical protein
MALLTGSQHRFFEAGGIGWVKSTPYSLFEAMCKVEASKSGA